MLSGIRVLDLSQESGFLAGKILGDSGADVIKVEPPGGDREGRRGPYLKGNADPECSLLWLALNTSKRGITLKLDTPAGADLFRRLVSSADVVLETLRPGTMDGWGLGYEALRQENPRLVYCALTPFGQSGPYADFKARDLVTVAMGGNPSMTGDPERAPVRCSMPTAYFHAGPDAATGIAMALFARRRLGRGQFVDVSMQETQLSSLVTGAGMYALSGKLGRRAGYRLGRTREIWRAKDGYVTFGLRGGQARLPNLMATAEYMSECDMAPEWLRKYDWSQYNHNTLTDQEIERFEAVFSAFFASKTMRELYEEALERRIMLAPCNNAREILHQPQLRYRELFVTLEYPEFGASIEHPKSFAKSNRNRIEIRCRAPRIGEHNELIYGELGLGQADLADLTRKGII